MHGRERRIPIVNLHGERCDTLALIDPRSPWRPPSRSAVASRITYASRERCAIVGRWSLRLVWRVGTALPLVRGGRHCLNFITQLVKTPQDSHDRQSLHKCPCYYVKSFGVSFSLLRFGSLNFIVKTCVI